MKLRYKCRWHHIGDNYFGVSFDEEDELREGVITLNEVGYDIVKQLETETSREAIVTRMLEEYEAEREEMEACVEDVVAQLREQGMVVE